MTYKIRNQKKLKQIEAIALKYGAVTSIGDYPYCAWFSKEVPNSSQWQGYWFAQEIEHPTCKTAIYISGNYTLEQQVYSFLHELGHVYDHVNKNTFKSEWDNEVSAWCNGLMLAIKFNVGICIDEYVLHAQACLATYGDKAHIEQAITRLNKFKNQPLARF